METESIDHCEGCPCTEYQCRGCEIREAVSARYQEKLELARSEVSKKIYDYRKEKDR